MEQAPPIRGIRMDSAAWKAACERAMGQAPSVLDPIEEWRAAGLVDETGDIAAPVLTTIRAHLTAPVVFHVSAYYRDLLHACEVSLAGALTTSTLARFRVAASAAGGTQLVGADPEVEFANTDGVNPWLLIRRVLPPFDEFRSSTPGHRQKVTPLSIDEEAGRRLVSLWESGSADAAQLASALPKEWRDLQDADSSVLLKVFAKDADGAVRSVGAAAWLRGEHTGLIRFKTERGAPLLERVASGDLFDTVRWLSLGAMDAASAEKR